MALDVEQARHTHPPSARARALKGRQEHQEDSSWLWSRGLRLASAGGAGCSGCGRVLQPPGRGSAPQNCPPAAYSTASQPLPPPQGLYCGHISPPPTGSRAGARRARLGARTARKVQRVYCRPAASRLPDGSTRLAMRAPAALAAAPAAAALAAAALAGKRYDRRRPLHPRLPSRAPSRRARPTLLAHGTRRHSAAENRRCSARSARDLVLSRLDPAIPRVYL